IPHADDFGKMRGSARQIKALVVPMRDDFTAKKVEECLKEITLSQLIERYSVNGEVFIKFPAFEEHQSGLHKRTKSKFPDPEEGEEKEKIPGNSGNVRPELEQEQNRTEQEVEIEREKEKSTRAPKNKLTPGMNLETALLINVGIDLEVAKDFLKIRKNKITQTFIDGIIREAEIAEISANEAIRVCVERSWQTFNAGWDWNPKQSKQNGFSKVGFTQADLNSMDF
ncbi:MAG: hypothetical protein KGI54_15090, partial [Pseudomonadota bacterium]|nr:hypothetical protein [Pseudomonadota bacterium]